MQNDLFLETPSLAPMTARAPSWRDDASVIGLVGVAHAVSHFSQLILAPLFPFLKDEFGVSYTQLGFLLTVYFVVSCAVQALSGFVVDRFGPRPVLLGGLALLAIPPNRTGRGPKRSTTKPDRVCTAHDTTKNTVSKNPNWV